MNNRFTQKAEAALNAAVAIAEELGHTYIGTEHVMLALCRDETSCAYILLKKRKITTDRLRSAIKEYSGVGIKSSLSAKDMTPRCRRILENSYKSSRKYSSERIGTEHILLSLLEERECVAVKLLLSLETDIIALKDEVVTFLRASERITNYAPPPSESAIPNLSKYGKNMTLAAEADEFDPVIGRDTETERVIRILTRKNKNNPCLIGEAGVGKTAIVEGLAKRISEGNVPASLIGKSIISVDLTSMVAGAKYRGDFEERIKNIMSEASKNRSVILFIDEIHTIVGAGSAEGAIDASNIMKPELARGDIRIIGATTVSEYRRYIEKDAALERRFQPVLIEEPSPSAALNILKGLKGRYEEFHSVKIDEEALESAVKLSVRYIQDRFLPDKALDALDEACAMANSRTSRNNKLAEEKTRQIEREKASAIEKRDFAKAFDLSELEKRLLKSEENIENDKQNEVRVRADDIISIISETTGIDISNDERGICNNIELRLKQSVIGQDAAVEVISSSIRRSYAGINDPKKPRGVFMFLGESGVGKTELAKAMARELFGTEESVIRYDMSEYSESYSVSKLIGSAPGYVGYEDAIPGFERIRRRPYSIILLDEIEKAHPDILSLFLQVFENGIITDARGRKISFRNTYIIMTSNIGADKFKGSITGFMNTKNISSVQEKLKSYFKEEFINRIDDIVLFSSIDRSAKIKIAHKRLEEIRLRLNEAGYTLIFDDCVCEYFADEKEPKGFGVRPMNRRIVTEVENVIADMIIGGEFSLSKEISLSFSDGKISVTSPQKAYCE